MANKLYSTLFAQVNKLFGFDYLLTESFPDDIINWMSNVYDVKLEGKVLNIKDIGTDIFIIKDNNIDEDSRFMDTILVDNKQCKVIVISRYFNELEIEKIQRIILDIYKFILGDLFNNIDSDSGLRMLNNVAPYILTAKTMVSKCLTFEYKVFELDEDKEKMLSQALEYEVDTLLDGGLLLKFILEKITI